jgi:hypothetical protein
MYFIHVMLLIDCSQMFTNNFCQNNGYLDPRTCSRCICPDGFSGSACDQRDSTSNCGDTIVNLTPSVATEMIIENPFPSSTIARPQNCVYHIRVGNASMSDVSCLVHHSFRQCLVTITRKDSSTIDSDQYGSTVNLYYEWITRGEIST